MSSHMISENALGIYSGNIKVAILAMCQVTMIYLKGNFEAWSYIALRMSS